MKLCKLLLSEYINIFFAKAVNYVIAIQTNS
jgi:hypothetical protein